MATADYIERVARGEIAPDRDLIATEAVWGAVPAGAVVTKLGPLFQKWERVDGEWRPVSRRADA